MAAKKQSHRSREQNWWLPVRRGKGEGHGTPLQSSCLENPMDGGAWWAAVHGVAKSRTQLHFHFLLSCIGEGNGNPLQCSCLENPRDRGAWWAAVSGVTQSQTRLKWLSSSSSSSKERKGRRHKTDSGYKRFKLSILCIKWTTRICCTP